MDAAELAERWLLDRAWSVDHLYQRLRHNFHATTLVCAEEQPEAAGWNRFLVNHPAEISFPLCSRI